MKLSLQSIIGILLAAAPSFAWSQDEPDSPPAEIAKYRSAFEETSSDRSKPAVVEFGQELGELAKARIAQHDYEGAMRARNRQMQLADFSTPDDGESGVVEVDLSAASRTGSGLKFDTRESIFSGFEEEGQSLLWEISNITSGRYSVLVTYGCGKSRPGDDSGRPAVKTGGVFSIEEKTSLAIAPSPPLKRLVRSTGGWENKVTRHIGKITVTGNRLPLKLAVDSVGNGGLMHLFGIRLIRVPESQSIDSEGSAQELESSRSKFRSAILSKASPIAEAYSARLGAERKSRTDSGDLAAASRIQEEFLEAEKIAADPTLLFQTTKESATVEPDIEIVKLEETHRSRLIEIRRELGAGWLQALTKLQDDLTRREAFIAAVEVRDEHARVTKMLKEHPLPESEPAPVLKEIVLAPRDARLNGKIGINENRSVIEKWRGVNASAVWDLPTDMAPGSYECILTYRCGEGGGGEFTVAIGDSQSLDGKVIADIENGWNTDLNLLAGECTLDVHAGQLKITTSKLYNRSLMNLISIRLAPQGTWSAMQAAKQPDA